jgi:uncharacterized Zn-finger protein
MKAKKFGKFVPSQPNSQKFNLVTLSPYQTVSYLEAHENEHKGHRPYICDTCGKSFASNGMLRSHKFAHAPKIFKCDCCDQARDY